MSHTTDNNPQRIMVRSERTAAFLFPTLASAVSRNASRRAADEARICNSSPSKQWATVSVPDGLLRLDETFVPGQAFRWINGGPVRWDGRDGALYSEWAGVISDVPVILRESIPASVHAPGTVHLRLDDGRDSEQQLMEVRDYLRADIDLTDVFARFCKLDERVAAEHAHHPGCRLLRQNPTETLAAHICASNNNIQPITQLTKYLAAHYGRPVGAYYGETLYAFPTAEKLAEEATEEALRTAGFGYRARFISRASNEVCERASSEGADTAEEWLLSLRDRNRQEVEKKLTQVYGIGQKVAGCIALMSMEQYSNVPVDIDVVDYVRPYVEMKAKSITKRVYNQTGDYFRNKFGEENGALVHNALFTYYLRLFVHFDSISFQIRT